MKGWWSCYSFHFAFGVSQKKENDMNLDQHDSYYKSWQTFLDEVSFFIHLTFDPLPHISLCSKNNLASTVFTFAFIKVLTDHAAGSALDAGFSNSLKANPFVWALAHFCSTLYFSVILMNVLLEKNLQPLSSMYSAYFLSLSVSLNLFSVQTCVSLCRSSERKKWVFFLRCYSTVLAAAMPLALPAWPFSNNLN